MDTIQVFTTWLSGLPYNVVIGMVLFIGGWTAFLCVFIDAGKD